MDLDLALLAAIANGNGGSAGGGAPAITFHGDGSNTTGTDASQITTGTIPAGALVVYKLFTQQNRSLSSISDPSGDTWTRATAYAPNAANQIGCAWKIASAPMAPGTTITAAISGSGAKQIAVMAITNMDPAQSVVQGTGAFGTSTTPAGSITPANASDIVVGITGYAGGVVGDAFAHDAAFGNAQNRFGTADALYTASRTAGSTSPITKTDSNGVSRVWLVRLFSFKAA